MIVKKLKLSIKFILFLFLFSVAGNAFLAFPKTTWSVANLQNAKDTLSDSRPSNSYTQHTIYFQATTAIPAVAGQIIVDFPTPSKFDITGDHTYADMTLEQSANADMSSPTACTLGTTATVDVVGVTIDTDADKITFIMPSSGSGNCASGIAADQYVEITIGDGAASGDDDIANPAKSAAAGTADTYVIDYSTYNSTSSANLDTATVRVAIIDAVTITAEVKATLECSVAGVALDTNFNASPGGNTYGTAGFDTLATLIPFGVLNSGSASQSGQLLKASTNGANGFYFAVKHYECNSEAAKGTLCSSGTDDIDVFTDGSLTDNTTPAVWAAPSATPGTEEEYGHIGYGATDLTLNDLNGEGDVDRFDSAKFAGLSTTYEAVLSHDGTCDGTGTDTNGQGYVVYKTRISGFQEAGIYSGTISYLCTGRY